MQEEHGYMPEEITDLREQYRTFDPSGNGIPLNMLPKLLLNAFPACDTEPRQRTHAQDFAHMVKHTWNGKVHFDAFLNLVRLAQDEAEVQDFDDENRLMASLGLSRDELRDFREIFVGKAQHRSSLSCADLFDILDFVVQDFNKCQAEKLIDLINEFDKHNGTGLRFPDFLRFMRRLTEERHEKDLGIVRAALRHQRMKDAQVSQGTSSRRFAMCEIASQDKRQSSKQRIDIKLS